ncbi:MAG: HNH endonuclease, partial [Clostridia bacterium]|nr:HNH endonuclease [Clostridia bacterium]
MRARETYLQRRILIDGGMCEDCGQVAGVEVHHKIHLTPSNIHDPRISLGQDNMILLCFECHRRRHKKERIAGIAGRYELDELGNVIEPNKSPPMFDRENESDS